MKKPAQRVERNLRDVVNNLGGEFFAYTFRPLVFDNGGCGTPVNVAGTNGGQMPCGAELTRLDGSAAPYYCGHCDKAQT